MISAEAGRLTVKGDITMQTAAALQQQGETLCAAAGNEVTWVVDLSAVNTVDSAALAVLLAWQRAAHAAGKTLGFVGVPSQLRALSALYDLDDILVLKAPAP